MNVKHVIGLAAIVLGGMTSCSNILEEDGVSNVITKGETGTLQINLVADGSLNITTKVEADLTNDYKSLLDLFKVTLTKTNEIKLPEGTVLPSDESFGTIKEKLYKLQKDTKCRLSASYGSAMENVFGWECPIFQGTSEEITINANATNSIQANCTLQNSLVNIDISDLTNNGVTNISIDGISGDETFPIYGDRNTTEYSIGNNTLYVQAGKDAKLVLSGKFTPKGGSEVSFATPAEPLVSSGEAQTTAKKRYDVTYTLRSDNGQLRLVVTIDGNVDIVDIAVPVDPYNPTPSQES